MNLNRFLYILFLASIPLMALVTPAWGQQTLGLEKHSNSFITVPDSIEEEIELILSGERKIKSILPLIEQMSIVNPKLALYTVQTIDESKKKWTISPHWAKLQYYKIWLLVREIAENEELEVLLKEAQNWSEYFGQQRNNYWQAKTQSLISNISYNICFNNNDRICHQAFLSNEKALWLLSGQKDAIKIQAALLGEIYRIKGNIYLLGKDSVSLDSSLTAYDNSLKYYELANDKRGQADLFLNKAISISYLPKIGEDGSNRYSPNKLYEQAIAASKNLGDTNAIVKAYLEYATYFANKYTFTKKEKWFYKSNEQLQYAIRLSSSLTCEIYMQLAVNLQNWLAFNPSIKEIEQARQLDSIALEYLQALKGAKKENNLRCYKELLNRIAIICPYLNEQNCTDLLHASDSTYVHFIKTNKAINERITQKNTSYRNAIEVQKRYNLALCFLILLILIAMLFFYQRKKEEVKNLNKTLEVKLEALRAQMNPHFISNTMNAIESLVNQNRNEEASEYLIDFSRLCRMILDYSKHPYISLKEEVEALKYFLALEKLRLTDDLDYSISIDNSLNQDSILIPPMLLQPFVENAIWHGIKNKTEPKNGELKIEVNRINQNKIVCIIEDNGVGRAKAKEIHENSVIDRKSWGTIITQERIDALQKMDHSNLSIYDLVDKKGRPRGTKVVIQLPILYKKPKR